MKRVWKFEIEAEFDEPVNASDAESEFNRWLEEVSLLYLDWDGMGFDLKSPEAKER